MDHPRDTAARRGRVAIGVTLVLLILGACSSAKGSAGAKPTTTASTSGSTTASTTTACAPPSSVPPATAVSGSTSDWTVTSFDGTRIRAHWFPVAGATATAPAPTVLMGPGWSLPGDTDTSTSKVGLLGALTIADLHKAGYNVLTWDPRGFGASTGDVESDSPAYEGRDVSALISWVATQPGVQLDRAHDPRMGMVGASYGGGIQFVTAAADCRVDALVPTIAWHSLGSSLYKTEIVKAGWSGLLETAAAGHSLDPHIPSAYAEGNGDRPAQRRQPRLVPGPRPGRPHQAGQGPHLDRAGNRRHPLHARRGRHQLRDPAQAGRARVDALVLQRPRRLPDEDGRPAALRAGPPSPGSRAT